MTIRTFAAALAFIVPTLAFATEPTVPTPLPERTFAELGIPAPPPLSTDKLYQTNTEIGVAQNTDIAGLRRFMERNPITDFFVETDAIPRLDQIVYLSGHWPEVGAIRRVDLADGKTVHERVITNDADQFTYQIWNFTSPEGRFIDHIKGEFVWTQTGGDVTVEWDYNIKPAAFFARPSINGFLKNDFGPVMESGLTGVIGAFNSK